MTETLKSALHFVGFETDSEYWSAVRIWGKPSFIHMANDPRFRIDAQSFDTVIFANKTESNLKDKNYPDTKEKLP